MKWAPLVPELLVSSFQQSYSFYVDTLAFTVEFTRDEPPFAYLSLEGAQLMIQEERDDDPWRTGYRAYPYGRGMNLQLEVDSINRYKERLEAEEYPLFEDAEESWYQADGVTHGQKEFLVQDPDGYLLRFAEYLGTR